MLLAFVMEESQGGRALTRQGDSFRRGMEKPKVPKRASWALASTKERQKKAKLNPVLTQALQNITAVRAVLGAGILGRKNIHLIIHLGSKLEEASSSWGGPLAR